MSDNWGLPTQAEKEAQKQYESGRSKGSIIDRIGFNIAGFRVKIHWSLLLMFVLYVFTSGKGVAAGMVMWFITMASVLLHELGHSIASRAFGYPVRVILLHILGGTAVADKLPINPFKRLITYAAGPFVSVILAAISLAMIATFYWDGKGPSDATPFYLMFTLIINIALTAFNIIPLYPLDGGGIMHSLNLMCSKNYDAACRRTAVISTVCGLAAAVFMLSHGAIWGGVILLMVIPMNIQLYKNGDGMKPWGMN